MLEQQKAQLIKILRYRNADELVISAIKKIPREDFVPAHLHDRSYDDTPLGIGESQTISQPSLAAYMTEKLQLTKKSRVLEIGTGSGYQTALLAELAGQVYTIEVRKSLAEAAQKQLESLNYKNIHYRIGNGMLGWREEAPFDAIILTAAAAEFPDQLAEQLNVNGRMIVPMHTDHTQELFLMTNTSEGLKTESLLNVRFVPIVSKDPKEPNSFII